MRRIALPTALFLLLPLAAMAQPAACPQAVPATTLGAAMAAPGAVLTPGTAVNAQLHPVEHVQFAPAPDRKPPPGTHAGIFVLDVPSAGIWRVGINSRAWIDVIQNGRTLRGATHPNAGGCTLFTKQVDFTLAPGRTQIQISSNPEPAVAILVEKAQ